MITCCYIDFETGGVEAHHPNIQLGAVAIGPDWEELGSFNKKIQFDESLADPEALKINHYDKEVWAKEAIPSVVCVSQFSRFLNEYKSLEMVSKRTGAPYSVARLAGFNAATFDGPRLRAMFNGTFLPAHPIPICILQAALLYFHVRAEKPENYKLGTLCNYFSIPIPEDGQHDALQDVRLTVKLAKTICGAMQS